MFDARDGVFRVVERDFGGNVDVAGVYFCAVIVVFSALGDRGGIVPVVEDVIYPVEYTGVAIGGVRQRGAAQQKCRGKQEFAQNSIHDFPLHHQPEFDFITICH